MSIMKWADLSLTYNLQIYVLHIAASNSDVYQSIDIEYSIGLNAICPISNALDQGTLDTYGFTRTESASFIKLTASDVSDVSAMADDFRANMPDLFMWSEMCEVKNAARSNLWGTATQFYWSSETEFVNSGRDIRIDISPGNVRFSVQSKLKRKY